MIRFPFIFAIVLFLLRTSSAQGLDIGIRLDDVNEPYSAYLQSVNGLFLLRHDGQRSETIRFQDLPPGHYMLDVKFLSGHEIACSVRVPASSSASPLRLRFSRKDAFFAKDLAEAANRVSVGHLRNEEELIQMVRDFERALGSDDAERAEEILAEATGVSPDAALAWNNLGALRLQQNRLDEAIPLLAHAVRLNERIFEAHVNLARAYGQKEKSEAALRHARIALALRPRHPNALSMMVGLLFLADRRAEALPHLELLLDIDPDHICRPGLLMAGILQDRGEAHKAAEMVLAYVRKHPEYELAKQLEKRASEVLRASAVAQSRNLGQ